jgi:hypothetical protein
MIINYEQNAHGVLDRMPQRYSPICSGDTCHMSPEQLEYQRFDLELCFSPIWPIFLISLSFSLPSPSQDTHTAEPAYNDIGLYDTSAITSDILWRQLIPHC